MIASRNRYSTENSLWVPLIFPLLLLEKEMSAGTQALVILEGYKGIASFGAVQEKQSNIRHEGQMKLASKA